MRKKLGELLVEAGMVNAFQLQTALAQQRTWGGRLGSNIVKLGYLKEGGRGVAYGEATLTVEIEILMFSMEVSVSCRREFGGGEADPHFIDLMPTPQIWSDYCDAFADEAA